MSWPATVAIPKVYGSWAVGVAPAIMYGLGAAKARETKQKTKQGENKPKIRLWTI